MEDHTIRVLIYCQDSLGLGHLRRNINIAHEISRLAPGTAFLFVTDSPMAPFFALPPHSDFVKLPTLVKVSAGGWKAHRLSLITLDSIWAIRAQLIKEVALNFRPDILLVDHMPHGARGELIESLQDLRRESPHTQIIVGLRDIIGAPEVITRQWQIEGAYQAIADYYDSVFVYGCRDIYDLTREYQFSEELQRKVRFCGYVCSPTWYSPGLVERLLPQSSPERPFTVLMMGGGGSDAHFLMNTMLDAVRLLGDQIPFNTFVLTGPFMPAKQRHALMKKAAGLPVVVKYIEDDSIRFLQQVDLVVSMGGYNTICEILRFAKKAVVVPRWGPSAEQSMRSRILHDLGIIVEIHPDELTPQVLADSVLNRLNDPTVIDSSLYLDLNGARNAAQYALERVNWIPNTEIPQDGIVWM